jgi:hypothetical protein
MQFHRARKGPVFLCGEERKIAFFFANFAPSRLRAFAPSRLRAFAPSRLRAFAPSRLRVKNSFHHEGAKYAKKRAKEPELFD